MSKLALAAVLLAATPAFAQQSGVSRPPDVEIETSAPQTTAPVPVVSAPVMVVPAATSTVPGLSAASAAAPGSDSPAITLQRRDLAKFAPVSDPDSKVVGDDVVQNPNEVPAGTMVRAQLKTAIETATTQPGTPFRAEITQPVQHEGRVVIPAGSMVEGQITEIRGGRRLHGPALIHLQAQTIVLPDGSRMPVHASVVDTDQFSELRVDDEGSVVRKDHAKQTIATLSLTTGSAAAAGGIIAGVPGALIGAGVGAGVSTVMWLKADRQATLPVDSAVVLALDAPLPIQPLVREPDYSAQPAATPLQSPATAVPSAPAATEPQAFVPVS